MGRKSCFNEAIRATIIRLAEEGKTDEEIAEMIGVSRTTLTNWKGKYQDFSLAVREAKHMADELVEAALFSRATGYTHDEENVIVTKQGDVVPVTKKKHYPPDTQAAMFWLRNRKPADWREKNESDVTVNNTVQTQALSDAEIEARIQALMQKENKPE